jgi:2-polyprenyl-3-methyl-5-hydroxy-6-metoxy-1,4-benzoquinol methylase
MKQEPIIESPLVPGGKTKYIRNIPISKVISGYMKNYAIDPSSMFSSLDHLRIYRCTASGYEFYYPLNLMGNSKFYETLAMLDWYYMPWKWEHEISMRYISDDMSLLEVGCAHGAFLSGICDQFNLSNIIGLELNETTPVTGKKFKIENQSIESFCVANPNAFDVVCSFQVLEHISEAHSFLNAKVACLKKGGRLIISVPNNESYLKLSDSVLNMPPHHVGLWGPAPLRHLEKLFPLNIVDIHYEPLADYHIDSYLNATRYARYPKIIARILVRLDKVTGKYRRMTNDILGKRDTITGHTVLAVFEKY